MKNFSRTNSEEVMAIRKRAEQAITTKIKERIYDLNGYWPTVQTKHDGNFTYLLFRIDDCKWTFSFQTRHCGSRDIPSIIIEKPLLNKLIKLNNSCDVVRHLVMFNDGHTIEIDVTQDKYINDTQELPRRTATKNGKLYIEKRICRFGNNKNADPRLDFDAEWVWTGKHKPVIVEEQKIKPKPLF